LFLCSAHHRHLHSFLHDALPISVSERSITQNKYDRFSLAYRRFQGPGTGGLHTSGLCLVTVLSTARAHGLLRLGPGRFLARPSWCSTRGPASARSSSGCCGTDTTFLSPA